MHLWYCNAGYPTCDLLLRKGKLPLELSGLGLVVIVTDLSCHSNQSSYLIHENMVIRSHYLRMLYSKDAVREI